MKKKSVDVIKLSLEVVLIPFASLFALFFRPYFSLVFIYPFMLLYALVTSKNLSLELDYSSFLSYLLLGAIWYLGAFIFIYIINWIFLKDYKDRSKYVAIIPTLLNVMMSYLMRNSWWVN